MIIKQSSLHFRLYSKYFFQEIAPVLRGERNFCQYSRGVFGGVFVACVIIFVGLCLGFGAIQMVVGLKTGVSYFNPESLAYAMAHIGIGGIALLIILGIGYFFLEIIGPDAKRSLQKYLQTHEPGFIRTWAHAVKNKICPMVTVERS
jgi:hypothetical protein